MRSIVALASLTERSLLLSVTFHCSPCNITDSNRLLFIKLARAGTLHTACAELFQLWHKHLRLLEGMACGAVIAF